jgi:hypothetical protein
LPGTARHPTRQAGTVGCLGGSTSSWAEGSSATRRTRRRTEGALAQWMHATPNRAGRLCGSHEINRGLAGVGVRQRVGTGPLGAHGPLHVSGRLPLPLSRRTVWKRRQRRRTRTRYSASDRQSARSCRITSRAWGWHSLRAIFRPVVQPYPPSARHCSARSSEASVLVMRRIVTTGGPF